MALKSPFFHLLLFSILLLLLPGSLSNRYELKDIVKRVRSDRILAENNSSRSSNSSLNSSLVPALYVLGDSTVDCGTNNYLLTLANANHLPYGRDFDTHRPTGRFCNGRIPVDYLALRLGLPFVPSYFDLRARGKNMSHGANYASAGAGILFPTAWDLGMHVYFAQQIVQAKETFEQITLSLGAEAATDMISKSVFYISIGSNDFIHYYLLNVSGVQSLYLPWEYNQLLITAVKQELKSLYYANARKMVVMGLGPLGCIPYYLRDTNDEHCVKEINNLVVEFNFAMRYMVDKLNGELPDANITFCDASEGSMDILDNHQHYGFEITKEPCCDGHWIMCLSPSMACSNASNHVWWDQFHPTDAVNAILADNVWSGLHSNMCYPMYLQDMVP